jgi:RNA recognition motif-containing protein
VEQLFGVHGEVRSVQIITDRDSGRSKGFGFVEMTDHRGADAAKTALNGFEVNGRQLTVNDARAREERTGGGYNGGGRY